MCSKAALQHVLGLQRLPIDQLLEEKEHSDTLFTAWQESPLQRFLGKIDSADSESLREAVRTAEFWISLLEGERNDLIQQVASLKRQCLDVSASSEALPPSSPVASESAPWVPLRKSKQSFSECDCDQNAGTSMFEHQDMLVAELKRQLSKEHEERHRLEQMLVKVKTQYGELLHRADSTDVVLAFYEDQLQSLVPGFEPINLETFQGWVNQPERDYDEESVNSDFSNISFSSYGKTAIKFKNAVLRRIKRKNRRPADITSLQWFSQRASDEEPDLTDRDKSPPPRPRARWEDRKE